MADERPLDEQVHLAYRDRVAWITIDRPEVANALNPPCRDRVRDILNGLNTSHRARAAVITGAGDRFFCTGADLRHSYRDPDRSTDVPDRIVGDPRRMMLDGQHSLFAALLDCDVPVLAAVNGTAAGMGAHLALACDLVIAGDGAKIRGGVRSPRSGARCAGGLAAAPHHRRAPHHGAVPAGRGPAR